jgi:anti-anti-sigma regulatory factor
MPKAKSIHIFGGALGIGVMSFTETIAAGRAFAKSEEPLIADAKPRVVALDLSSVPDLEYTALKMLTEAEKRQRERGVMLWLVGLNPEALKTVQNSELAETLGRERMFFNLERAVENFQGPSGGTRHLSTPFAPLR